MFTKKYTKKQLLLWNRMFGIGIVILAMVISISIFPNTGTRVKSAKIFYNGSVRSEASLYHMRSGDYILFISEVNRFGYRDNARYVLRPYNHQIAYIIGKTIIMPPFVISERRHPVGVTLGPGKTGLPLPKKCQIGEVDFISTASKSHVHIFW